MREVLSSPVTVAGRRREDDPERMALGTEFMSREAESAWCC